MTKHLTAIGNSLGLIIEKPILDLLRIDRDTPLEVTTDGHGLYIRPRGENSLLKPPDKAKRLTTAPEESSPPLPQSPSSTVPQQPVDLTGPRPPRTNPSDPNSGHAQDL